jgi:hypothetical protein
MSSIQARERELNTKALVLQKRFSAAKTTAEDAPDCRDGPASAYQRRNYRHCAPQRGHATEGARLAPGRPMTPRA